MLRLPAAVYGLVRDALDAGPMASRTHPSVKAKQWATVAERTAFSQAGAANATEAASPSSFIFTGKQQVRDPFHSYGWEKEELLCKNVKRQAEREECEKPLMSIYNDHDQIGRTIPIGACWWNDSKLGPFQMGTPGCLLDADHLQEGDQTGWESQCLRHSFYNPGANDICQKGELKWCEWQGAEIKLPHDDHQSEQRSCIGYDRGCCVPRGSKAAGIGWKFSPFKTTSREIVATIFY
ncbi:unnamed protein product [Amoebophrya sp. A120]|nr:unnamed protein product [Amoebophrya sp. A120]|eukprot:GSA120T00022532001.1